MIWRAAAIAVVLYAVCSHSRAACVSSYYDANEASSIGVVSGTFPDDATVAAALEDWNNCPASGTGFPTLETGPAEITINVDFVDGFGPSGTGCGVFQHSVQSGPNGTVRVVGGTIVIYHYTNEGYDCSPNYEETITHELGHVLGLDNAGANCTGYMMGPAASRTRADGTVEVYPSRTVKGMECYGVNKQWLHGEETSPPEPSIVVPLDEQGGVCWECTPESPIVIQFAEGAFELSGPDDAVQFDINADGIRDRITWIGRSGEQALLARDRNGNGVIDDGSELFGTSTPLRSGAVANNGFDALMEFDENHDGVIDAGDTIWSELLVWFDVNHDGISQFTENETVERSMLREISLRYRTVNRRDQHGNWYRYRTLATLVNGRGHLVRRSVYDVFFVRTFAD